MSRGRWMGVMALSLWASVNCARGQELPADTSGANSPLFPPYDDIPAAVSFLSPLIIPKIFQDCARLKEYIRGEGFLEFRRRNGDLLAVDAIFDRALRLCWNNVYEALFISLWGTMDHRNFGVRLPFLGALLWVPLTSEFQDEFDARVSSLPKALYPDTPPGRAGDRDKLQHFFGSAFFAYLLESPDAADRLGRFVEWGEELFVVGGVNDERDLRADRQGEQFALALLSNRAARPSAFFTVPLHASPPPGGNEHTHEALDSLMEVR